MEDFMQKSFYSMKIYGINPCKIHECEVSVKGITFESLFENISVYSLSIFLSVSVLKK
jgi:hypothetical protein